MHPAHPGLSIRARRQTLGLTQRALAELAGVSVHALSNLESGAGNPTLGLLQRVAEVLGLELRLELRRPGAPEVPVPREGPAPVPIQAATAASVLPSRVADAGAG